MSQVDVTAELQRVKDISLALDRELLVRDPRFRETADRLIDACVAVARKLGFEPADDNRISRVASATPALADRIATLSAEGMGVRKIARTLGVHPSTVSRRLRATRNSHATPGGSLPLPSG